MQLRYVVVVVIVTFAACSSVASAAKAAHEAKLSVVASANGVHTSQANHGFVRSLLADDDNSSPKLQENKYFMEHKLQKALTNPKKTKKLYQFWFKKGYTVKQVSSDLGRTENRELSQTYTTISKGYAAFLKEQQ
ncbi:hypothetical protein PHYPSEUDO_009243 [Phytophthora pseudosyringae]|uniref:RxLR effector protein n=1 Tax=Phytophthora pseudosyringae TaxID=221518 RepID=A0A8T1VCF5_9STRA|nr:hypothetical protein PHYPSEUDO_009243 [Phytophthora pseudosyringae]